MSQFLIEIRYFLLSKPNFLSYTISIILKMESEGHFNYYCVVIFSVFLIFYSLLKYLKYHGIPENFPPGPMSIPFLGVLPFIKANCYMNFLKWIVFSKFGNSSLANCMPIFNK